MEGTRDQFSRRVGQWYRSLLNFGSKFGESKDAVTQNNEIRKMCQHEWSDELTVDYYQQYQSDLRDITLPRSSKHDRVARI